MKLIRLPQNKERDWWVFAHELTLDHNSVRKIHPIHIFTHLIGRFVKNHTIGVFNLCLALENKLYAIRLNRVSFRKSVIESSENRLNSKYVRDYKPSQKVICSLDNYLGSIYSSLEITAQTHALIHSKLNLPRNFRDQSKKVDIFSFKKGDWLAEFYDLRSELTHYSSSIPMIDEREIFVEFHGEKDRENFEKGKHRIGIRNILGYYPQFLKMLNNWSRSELLSADPKVNIYAIPRSDFNKPLKPKSVKVETILDRMMGCI